MRSTSADRVCPLQRCVPSLRVLEALKTLMTARHTRLRDSKSLFESFHFLRGLELALRPKVPSAASTRIRSPRKLWASPSGKSLGVTTCLTPCRFRNSPTTFAKVGFCFFPR